ncbi:hypothetical protein JHK84_040797 [Glycine max]|nr:hypothetical protein JHK86_040583 [Glycine max]KAG4966197.1 hypothetical protein JHK85_041172 [Glycine max]KAG5122457.1 hypothetical protein JHK84_040797 [Glycine max]
MQLIFEAYDVLKHVGGLSNFELVEIFAECNREELESFLIKITVNIFKVKDEDGEGFLVDKILDKTGMKGTEKWMVQQATELSIVVPTIATSLDCWYLSGLKKKRESVIVVLKEARLSDKLGRVSVSGVDKKRLIDYVRHAWYASKICSYARGMNLLRAKSNEKEGNLNLGKLARIWKGGCIIRVVFLDRIKMANQRNPNLAKGYKIILLLEDEKPPQNNLIEFIEEAMNFVGKIKNYALTKEGIETESHQHNDDKGSMIEGKKIYTSIAFLAYVCN